MYHLLASRLHASTLTKRPQPSLYEWVPVPFVVDSPDPINMSPKICLAALLSSLHRKHERKLMAAKKSANLSNVPKPHPVAIRPANFEHPSIATCHPRLVL